MSDLAVDELPEGDSFQTRVLRETWASLGARLGLGWIALVALAAVFAPFLANSHPLLLWTSTGWSSPAITHLTPTDVSLLGVFAVCVGVWFARRRLARTGVGVAAATLLQLLHRSSQ